MTDDDEKRAEIAREVWARALDHVVAALERATSDLKHLRDVKPATDPYGDGHPDYADAAHTALERLARVDSRARDLVDAARTADKLTRYRKDTDPR